MASTDRHLEPRDTHMPARPEPLRPRVRSYPPGIGRSRRFDRPVGKSASSSRPTATERPMVAAPGNHGPDAPGAHPLQELDELVRNQQRSARILELGSGRSIVGAPRTPRPTYAGTPCQPPATPRGVTSGRAPRAGYAATPPTSTYASRPPRVGWYAKHAPRREPRGASTR